MRNNRSLKVATRITLIYLAVGILWILTSDLLLGWFLGTPVPFSRVQTAKGCVFILATGWMLYALILSSTKRRERVEEEMRRGEERFRAMIENASDMVAIIDQAGVVKYVSPSLIRLFGYEASQWTGRNIFEFIHPEDWAAVVDALQKGIEHRDTGLPLELRALHKNGSWRVIEATDTNLLENESVRGIVINARDITDRKQLEEQLRQSHKMEAVGRLAGGVAHDFNNLLTAINGYSDLLISRLDHSDPMLTGLQEIRQAGERAAALTRQLLAFSRKQVIHPRVVDLNQVITDSSGMLRRLIREDIDLKLDLSPAIGRIKADPVQIEQVLMNLSVNARDAMPEGGKLVIETSQTLLDQPYIDNHIGAVAGPYVMLAVSDTGIGMNREVQSHLFEPFFTTKEPGRGTGLGLASVHGIVIQSGGHITVHTEPGKGSSFKVYFPCAEGDAEANLIEREHAALDRGTETVLLVEDEPLVRNLATITLRGQGYTVIEAEDGEVALRLLERDSESAIELLLTDVVMPKVNGRELAGRARSARPHLKVIYMSGYTDDAILHDRISDHDIHFLQKPFSPTTLLRKVREALDQKTAGGH